LLVSWFTQVDGFPGRSLLALQVGLQVSFFTLIDGFRGRSLVGFLVELRVSFPTLVDSLRGVDGFRCGSLDVLVVGLHASTAFTAARSSDYSSDCAPLFLHSSTAATEAPSSDYTSDRRSARL
jgi:hypothetical protein